MAERETFFGRSLRPGATISETLRLLARLERDHRIGIGPPIEELVETLEDAADRYDSEHPEVIDVVEADPLDEFMDFVVLSLQGDCDPCEERPLWGCEAYAEAEEISRTTIRVGELKPLRLMRVTRNGRTFRAVWREE